MKSRRHPVVLAKSLRPRWRSGRSWAKIFAIPLAWLSAMSTASAIGSTTLCNEGTDTYYYTVIVESGDGLGLSCELAAKRCHVDVAGWFKLEPGNCNGLDPGVRWETYLAIYRSTQPGQMVPSHFSIDPEFFRNREPGASGIEGPVICGRFDKFTRRFNGTLLELLNSSSDCPDGDSKLQFNFAIRTEPSTDFTAGVR